MRLDKSTVRTNEPHLVVKVQGDKVHSTEPFRVAQVLVLQAEETPHRTTCKLSHLVCQCVSNQQEDM